MQPRKGEMGFALHTERLEDGHAPVTGRPLGFEQQARLADTGLSLEQKEMPARRSLVHERRQQVLLVWASNQWRVVAASRSKHRRPQPPTRAMHRGRERTFPRARA